MYLIWDRPWDCSVESVGMQQSCSCHSETLSLFGLVEREPSSVGGASVKPVAAPFRTRISNTAERMRPPTHLHQSPCFLWNHCESGLQIHISVAALAAAAIYSIQRQAP